MICSISTRNENRAYFCHPFKTAFLLYPVILGYVHLFFPCLPMQTLFGGNVFELL